MFWYFNERDSSWFFGLRPRGFYSTWYILAIQDEESLAFSLSGKAVLKGEDGGTPGTQTSQAGGFREDT